MTSNHEMHNFTSYSTEQATWKKHMTLLSSEFYPIKCWDTWADSCHSIKLNHTATDTQPLGKYCLTVQKQDAGLLSHVSLQTLVIFCHFASFHSCLLEMMHHSHTHTRRCSESTVRHYLTGLQVRVWANTEEKCCNGIIICTMEQSQGFQLKNYRPFSSRQSIREYPCGESCAGKRWTGWPNRTFPSLIWLSEFHAFWQYYKVRQAFLFRRGIKVSKNQHQLKKCRWGNCDCSRQKDISSQESIQCLCLLYMLKPMVQSKIYMEEQGIRDSGFHPGSPLTGKEGRCKML